MHRPRRPGPHDHVGPLRRPGTLGLCLPPPAPSATAVGAVQVRRRRADDRHLGPDALARRSRDRAPRRRERLDDPQSAAADLVPAHPALDRDTRTVVVDLDPDAAVVDLQPQGDPGPAGVGSRSTAARSPRRRPRRRAPDQPSGPRTPLSGASRSEQRSPRAVRRWLRTGRRAQPRGMFSTSSLRSS